MLKNERLHFIVFAIILILGIFLRASTYFQNPALWLDEAITANRLIFNPLQTLIQPVDSCYKCMHAYPIGFMLFSKVIIWFLGAAELALRLIPFLAGIISLFLFRRITKKVFSPLLALFTFALFAVCHPLILHSIELKPYSTDVLFSITLILMSLSIIKSRKKKDAIYCNMNFPTLVDSLFS